MSFTKITNADPELARLVDQALAKIDDCPPAGPARWLLVDVLSQRAVLLREATPLGTWPVSTAAVGLDNRDGSGGTPPGVHGIARRIGDGAPEGTIFVDRKPTGRCWLPGDSEPGDLILTRILTLAGREPGLNHGPGVDSLERYIYLHGTNHEDRIGQPVSHGCVRLTNADIRDVFDRMDEGDPVVII